MCARFLHEIYSCYFPEFDDLSVAREANRVWPVSLPEETDIFIVNKIVDQLRDLLHRKLMEEDGKIQMLYNQMKNDKAANESWRIELFWGRITGGGGQEKDEFPEKFD